MNNSRKKSSNKKEKEIEKILKHKIISEFDIQLRRYYNIYEYKIKWVGDPKPIWVKESNLGKYKDIVNNYKNLYVNNDASSKKIFSTSLYTRGNMRIGYNETTSGEENKNVNFLFDEDNFSENHNNEEKIFKKIRKKAINEKSKDSEVINLNESLSDINESNENKSLNKRKRKYTSNKNKIKKKENNKIINSDYSNFGPTFFNVMNAYNNLDLQEKALEKILLNQKRKNTDISDSFTISIEGDNSKAKVDININKADFLNKINQIIIPLEQNENILVDYKKKSKEKYINIKENSNSKNIPKEELLRCYEHIIKTNLNEISKDELIFLYEKIIKKYLKGNTYKFY